MNEQQIYTILQCYYHVIHALIREKLYTFVDSRVKAEQCFLWVRVVRSSEQITPLDVREESLESVRYTARGVGMEQQYCDSN